MEQQELFRDKMRLHVLYAFADLHPRGVTQVDEDAINRSVVWLERLDTCILTNVTSLRRRRCRVGIVTS